jgi:phosphatidylglycerophosphatase A
VNGRPRFARLAVVVGSFAGCGFFPVAPATFASAVAAPLLAWGYHSWWRTLPAQVAVIVVLFLLGAWAAGRLERVYGKDPSAAVVDEVLGMAIALAGAPFALVPVGLAFLAFRFFDVLKPPPGRALERLPGGWGIMADDACAGLYAALVLQATLRLWPEPRLGLWHGAALFAAAAALFAFRKPLLRRYGKRRCDPRLGLGGPGTS